MRGGSFLQNKLKTCEIQFFALSIPYRIVYNRANRNQKRSDKR